ncbi:MAG TPA: hypothetical protein VGF56_11975 [Rhizomicrobium sp.]|jgi:hypothetical protein
MVRGILFGALIAACVAHADTLAPELAPVQFLIGDWTGQGKSEGNTTDRGRSSIKPIVGGHALLRRDHNDVSDAKGKLVESFDQVMTIYPEGGALKADYLDGAHVIHYVHADVKDGQSVQFVTATSAQAPTFRLTYTKASPGTLAIKFEMEAPGQNDFHTVAEGTVTRKKP